MSDTTTSTGVTATENDSVSEAVVAAVADASGVSPLDLEPPLYAVVDSDALDAFVESVGDGPAAGEGRIEFVYAGYDVAVTGTGDVQVADRGG